MPKYNVWTEYGERGIMLENNEEEEENIPDFADDYGDFFEYNAMAEPEEAEGHAAEYDLCQMLREV
jgi:hypothetical protein